MKIRAGCITAIVGRTGSGKSTIANLLSGLVVPQAGTIRVDGRDVAELDLLQLRARVASVPQESFLFADTIRNNVRFGNPAATDAEVIHAAQVADAHDFILDQPQGYDTIVGESGITLSGGQRQRITIAQAVLVQPSVLVLDDSTSALDSVTEERVVRALKNEMRDKTIIIISHRASMVQHADEVQLLHEGRILRTGTHAELLAGEPAYREVFVQSQRDPSAAEPQPETDQEYYQRIRSIAGSAAHAEVSIGTTI